MPNRRSLGRAAVLEQIESIRSEIESGLSVRLIFESRSATIGIGYEQFRRLVRRYVGRLDQAGVVRVTQQDDKIQDSIVGGTSLRPDHEN